jgi:hypothetical protein
MVAIAAECPFCSAPLTVSPESGQEVHCRYCGSALHPGRTLCPDCATLNRDGTTACRQCGASLLRRCTHCQTENWAGRETCSHCGKPLDILEAMTQPRRRDTRGRMSQQQEEAAAIKAREAAAGEARMAHFRDLDRQRQAEQERQRAEQAAQRQKMLLIAGGAALVMCCLLAGILAFWLWRMP